MNDPPLAAFEEIIGASGAAPRIEAMLPIGVRSRQLLVRTLLLGIMITLADHRPAHLTRVHQALVSLPAGDQRRLGVIADWRRGPHLLTYRQTERTFALVAGALGNDDPDGLPSSALQRICDDLLEASVPDQYKDASTSLAADWTDVESFSRPPPHDASAGDCADPEAAWGHRTVTLPGPEGELFFGYYGSAAIMTRDENGPPVPELARRFTLSSCRQDPVRAFAPVLTAMPAAGIPLGDVLADSGYAHRDPAAWAIPLRAAGASLVQDLHPHDRGPKGTHHGAIIANGNLYCPAAPRSLLDLGPLAPGAEDTAAHDAKTAEVARYKLGRLTSDDADGYHRVQCPAVLGKIRCPLRPASMTLERNRPEVLTPPEQPQACCTQQSITVTPDIAAKTRQKHDYPSQAHRRSYARRTAAERGFSGIKDTAGNDIARGWCRLMGLAPLALFTTTLFIVRNQHAATTWNTRQQDKARRAAAGLPPRTRRRGRRTLTTLTAGAGPP